MKIIITGADGLLGWHAHTRLHAANCADKFAGIAPRFEIVALNRKSFQSDTELDKAVSGAVGVLHFAGVNRADDSVIAEQNPAIAQRLLDSCRRTNSQPYIAYANSTHSAGDSVYGKSKRRAAEILHDAELSVANIIFPHIYGESAKPFYNNVTSTLIDQIINEQDVSVNPDGAVNLLHAGDAADIAIQSIVSGSSDDIRPDGDHIGIPDLYEMLSKMHKLYENNIYPDFRTALQVKLFNAYRFATYPQKWPRKLQLNEDNRGVLFEAVKGGGNGQSFLSTTMPGITRGDHFHLNKVERFLVVQGEAIIRMRKVLGSEVLEFKVGGDAPAAVDMPTMFTHSIENVGSSDLTTLFWTHEIFDPENPDTYADAVLQ